MAATQDGRIRSWYSYSVALRSVSGTNRTGDNSKLPVEVGEDSDRHLSIPVEKAARLAQDAQLQGEAAPVVVSAAPPYRRLVASRIS